MDEYDDEMMMIMPCGILEIDKDRDMDDLITVR